MIKGIVSAVPSNVVRNEDEKFIRMTGVRERRVTPDLITVDYAFVAAMQLLRRLGWDEDSLGAIVFVTQTPRCAMPATACLLAGLMGVKCAAFDVNLACSGYVYGMWLAHKIGGRVLVIAGDTVSKMCDVNDKGTYQLFGDAVTATACECPQVSWGHFILGTNGDGFSKLIADPLIKMQGDEVMNFALKTVPELVHATTLNAQVDWYLFHQANKFLLTHLVKKCGIEDAKCPINIERYGNTSSASIPLLMCDSAATEALKARKNRVAMFGFGAGWSWGGCMMDIEPLQVCEVISA